MEDDVGLQQQPKANVSILIVEDRGGMFTQEDSFSPAEIAIVILKIQSFPAVGAFVRLRGH